jgi:signal transduction histidine kinase
MEPDARVHHDLLHLAFRIAESNSLVRWADRLNDLRDAVGEYFGCTHVDFYAFHLASGTFHLEGTDGPPTRTRRRARYFLRSRLFVQAVTERVPVSSSRGEVVCIPVCRNEMCLFIWVLWKPKFAPDWRAVQSLFSFLIGIHLERRFERVLNGTRATYDYRQPRKEFMTSLGRRVLSASGMQYAILRTLQGDRLECNGAWGFPVEPNLPKLSWPADKYAVFERALEGETVATEDLRASELQELAQLPELRKVRGFVALPVRIEDHPYGVLTLSTSVPYKFVEPELEAFQILADTIALVIANYETKRAGEVTLPKLAEFSSKTTITTIASSARHEGLGHIDNAISNIALALQEKNDGRRKSYLASLEGSLHDVKVVLDKMRMAVKPPTYEWRHESLRRLWDQAVQQFAAKLTIEKIAIRSPQSDVVVGMYPDWVRAALTQLILNSIDAFGKKGYGLGKPAERGRFIQLHISTSGNIVRMRYTDNAGGINPSRLLSRSMDEELPLEERIFRPEATTKGDEGTGWGLPLARASMAENGGNLVLVDNAQHGVTFDIELPLHLEGNE